MSIPFRPLITLTAAAAVLFAITPVASALATDRYVVQGAMGLPPCTSPALPCPMISQATGASGIGDVIHVGGGTYAGSVSLPDGVSLVKDSFASPFPTAGSATIGTTAGPDSAITLAAGTNPRTISGFTLRGGNTGVLGTVVANFTSNVTFAGNTFDDHSPNVTVQLRIGGGGSQRVTGNTFIGANDGQQRTAVGWGTATGGSPEIDHNSIDAFAQGIAVSGSAPPNTTTFNIHDNVVTNIYDDAGLALPQGIFANQASGALRGNLVTEAAAQAAGNGINIGGPATATGTPTEVTGNRVFGFASYSQFGGPDPLLLADDVFTGTNAALGLFTATTNATVSNVTAVASAGASYDMLVVAAHATVDSSFIGPNGITILSSGSCASTYSVTTTMVAPCGMTPIANPLFANPAANDFSLQAGSPLIDAGDPAAPSPATDVAGNPRAIAILGCPPRRDIGAYEFNANPLDCNPPATPVQPTGAPATSAPRKKCKKRKRRHRSAVAAKKKRCKKKRR